MTRSVATGGPKKGGGEKKKSINNKTNHPPKSYLQKEDSLITKVIGKNTGKGLKTPLVEEKCAKKYKINTIITPKNFLYINKTTIQKNSPVNLGSSTWAK